MHSSLLQFRPPRGQKSAMGGCYGVRGRSPKPPEAIGSLTAKPPAAEAGGLRAQLSAAEGTSSQNSIPIIQQNFQGVIYIAYIL